ncbi:uncharacterized protein [Elaeis guineensis]|uniref:Uncharacterized protein LOC105061320 n=1 Tax=Elaeis guineensis var. tenera TaxID=51953 RepID=A0A6I9SJ09_ELAGV|nr:uncharacterized protein LOC105061320 [Elaeis guineensis]
MVVGLGPGRFYGSSLPRPRFYTEVKLNDERVDPPVPVMDPLLLWANDAHWSMGGLSFKRHRLQGRIEGSIKKLRAQQERTHGSSPSLNRNPAAKPRFSGHKPLSLASLRSDSSDSEEEEFQKKAKDVSIVSSPLIGSAQKRKRARRLGDEFDRIAEQQQMGKQSEEGEGVASRTRSRKPDVEEVELGEEPTVTGKGSVERRKRKEVDGVTPRRISPRKKKLI